MRYGYCPNTFPTEYHRIALSSILQLSHCVLKWTSLAVLIFFCAQSSELGVNPDCHSIEQSQFLHQCCDYNYVRIVFPQNMCDMCFPISILGTLFPTCFFKQGWHVCVNGFGDFWARHSHFHWCFLCMNFSDDLWYWGGNQLQIYFATIRHRENFSCFTGPKIIFYNFFQF